VPKATGQQLAQLPPEDQHPGLVFQNLPFVVQRVVNQADNKAQWYVLAGGPADLEAPILPPVTRVTTSVQVPILMYHHISDIPPQNVLDWSLTVTPTVFSQQLDYLKQQGYHSITFNQMFDALYYNGPLPSRPIILTFDDGYEDAYHFAYPILRQHGFSGMFYIITGKVNWEGQMTWAQLHEMVAHGMQMGSHTIHHVDMGQVLLNSQEQAQQELQISKITLEQYLGIVVQQFCYPSGEPFRRGSWYARQQIVLFLAQDGYVGATTDPGVTGVEQQSQEPFILLRIRVDGRESLQEFVSSLPW
jgi:peptidoglycan/xylan/chitin deacetylase (PgdA/CDA1 family)